VRNHGKLGSRLAATIGPPHHVDYKAY
jgi:hypothetical protein